jgi:predicted DNA-binding transcriptional regulator AlpA
MSVLNPYLYVRMSFEPEFIDKPEICRVLGIHTRTLDREIARLRFPRPYKIGSLSKFTRAQLFGYIKLLEDERVDRERSVKPAA